MVTLTKKITTKNNVVVIPRKEYEALLALKKIREFVPTSGQKKALVRAEKNFKAGKTSSYDELIKKLGFTH